MALRFRTRLRRDQHFDDHGEEVGAVDEADYETKAAGFLDGPVPGNTNECIRKSDGARIRWNYVTQEFGIVSADGFIQTYFEPDPKWHGTSTNRAYYDWECNRR